MEIKEYILFYALIYVYTYFSLIVF